MFLSIALVLHSQVVFFGARGKSAGTNIGRTAGDSIFNDRPRIRIASNKCGCPIQQPEHVIDDKNLPVTDAACCDAVVGADTVAVIPAARLGMKPLTTIAKAQRHRVLLLR